MYLELTRPVCGRCGLAYEVEPAWHGAEGVLITGTVESWKQRRSDNWFGRSLTRWTAVECCGVSAVVQFYREPPRV